MELEFSSDRFARMDWMTAKGREEPVASCSLSWFVNTTWSCNDYLNFFTMEGISAWNVSTVVDFFKWLGTCNILPHLAYSLFKLSNLQVSFLGLSWWCFDPSGISWKSGSMGMKVRLGLIFDIKFVISRLFQSSSALLFSNARNWRYVCSWSARSSKLINSTIIRIWRLSASVWKLSKLPVHVASMCSNRRLIWERFERYWSYPRWLRISLIKEGVWSCDVIFDTSVVKGLGAAVKFGNHYWPLCRLPEFVLAVA